MKEDRRFDHIIIGFGKGGKTLAGALAAAGERVALIEKSDQMYGGTCINVACIPTKFLENQARFSAKAGGSLEEKRIRYREAILAKRELTRALRGKNLAKAQSQGVDVIVGRASFTDEHHVRVVHGQEEQVLYGGQIYINTGATSFIPEIPGVWASKYVYTSRTMMELEELPQKLVIIGGGYIGLEFASYYANFGSQVTIIQDGDVFLPREDREIADAVYQSLLDRGVQIRKKAQVKRIHDMEDCAVVTVLSGQELLEIEAQAVLVATGRRPNVEGLNLAAAGVTLTERGAIAVNEYLRTSIPHIWAMGDVAGGLQFTYISLDDSRIVKAQLLGDGKRSTKNRGEIPYSVFLDPPFSRVGLTEEQAVQQGYDILVARLPVMAIPKAQVIQKPVGLMKAIVDRKTNLILGAHIFAAESYEVINVFKLAMDQHVPYQTLRDNIYTHPTMSEAINDLFAGI